ncbi:MAG TPA: ABC transporter ATP-binding protein [Casimicrobiaceae bacterium]|nr:ABC transporter ATP-binding protein [Casimicrobiaceae bacterium]
MGDTVTIGPVPRLELIEISKRYPGVVANDGVSLRVMPGEIHALLGENGAGKSTLMKIVYGVVHPDAGIVRWNGEPVAIGNPARARKLGIAMVFQHFSLFETLTVAENIALALPAARARRGLPARIREVSSQYGLPLEPGRYVHTMSVGERQRVEIVRCLLQSPQLLILDEPTSVLTPQAVQRLFETLRTLAGEGCSILYISHKLDEIRALCHRATVLRDGKVTGECDPRQESSSTLARMMIGTELPRPRHRAAHPTGAPLLRVRGLSRAADDPFGTSLVDIDLDVHGGEIVGIAGIAGNGQRELLAALSGESQATPADSVLLADEPIAHLDAAARRARGVAFVPEERLGHGAVPDMSLAENALLTTRRRLSRHGFIDASAAREYASATLREFAVKAQGPDAAASSLSGGNLQKFIVGREMRQSPKLLIAAQPTWGVDIGASAQVRQALLDLRDAGAAVLIVSEELDELFEIADRIAVMSHGRLSAAKPAQDTNAEEIGMLMSARLENVAHAA